MESGLSMARFSDRLGITKPPTELQLEKMNDELRASLWNVIAITVDDKWSETLSHLFIHYFRKPIDTLPEYVHECRAWLLKVFEESSWYEVYNLVEHVWANIEVLSNRRLNQRLFEIALNRVLERELSGYRAIDGKFVPITDKHEIESIRRAASEPVSLGFEGAAQHIASAFNLLSKKPEPDYRNSIKESISAVESICKRLAGEKSGGLDRALAKLSEKIPLHGSLKSGILSFYGYTSDESGIRHGMLEKGNVGFAEAKFMLIACSAFVNFLIDKARQVKLP